MGMKPQTLNPSPGLGFRVVGFRVLGFRYCFDVKVVAVFLGGSL